MSEDIRRIKSYLENAIDDIQSAIYDIDDVEINSDKVFEFINKNLTMPKLWCGLSFKDQNDLVEFLTEQNKL